MMNFMTKLVISLGIPFGVICLMAICAYIYDYLAPKRWPYDLSVSATSLKIGEIKVIYNTFKGNPNLQLCRDYIKWTINNEDVIIYPSSILDYWQFHRFYKKEKNLEYLDKVNRANAQALQILINEMTVKRNELLTESDTNIQNAIIIMDEVRKNMG